MNLFDVSAILLTTCTIFSFMNAKWIKLPSSIFLLLLAMVIGLFDILSNTMGLKNSYRIEDFLSNIDFREMIFHGMLSFLLFAGALQMNIEDLKLTKIPIAITAIFSTLLSTIIIGLLFYFFANRAGFTHITLLYALIFGAILSPTDPIAALSIIKKMQASKKMETIIIGESLFNDGVAIVFFLTLLELIKSSQVSILTVVGFFFQEVGGGIIFGIVIGWIAYQMLLRVDVFHIELLITLAVATGGYTLAEKLHISAPLAMVIAGFIIGNYGRSHAMSDRTKAKIESFWKR